MSRSRDFQQKPGFWVCACMATGTKTAQNTVFKSTQVHNTPQPIYFIDLHIHAHIHSDFWNDWLCFGRVAVSNIFTVVNALFGRDPKAKSAKMPPGPFRRTQSCAKKIGGLI